MRKVIEEDADPSRSTPLIACRSAAEKSDSRHKEGEYDELRDPRGHRASQREPKLIDSRSGHSRQRQCDEGFLVTEQGRD